MRRLLLLAWLASGCQQPAPTGTAALGDDAFRPYPTRVQPALDHEVYLATPKTLIRYRPTPQGLEELNRCEYSEESPVALAVHPQGVCYWRDFERFYWNRQLGQQSQRFGDFDKPYLQGQLAAFSGGFVSDDDDLLKTYSLRGELRGELELPGYVEQLWVEGDIAYVLDPGARGRSLLKVDLHDPERPEVLDRADLAGRTGPKGSQWLDLERRRWYVMQDQELLVFNSDSLSQGAIGRTRGLPPLTAQPDSGRFRLWKHTSTAPLWALGRDRELVLARLELTRQGLRVAERLPLKGFRFPLMSAPFVERAGSRLYASDGGGLWVIDLAGPRPRLLLSRPYRYGLTLATAPSWKPPSTTSPSK